MPNSRAIRRCDQPRLRVQPKSLLAS
jgi:hypothetical protein